MTIATTQKRILCVEDHDDTCELIAALLNDCKVISAKTKTEALHRALSEKFDLYILDYHLPDTTGLEIGLLIRTFDKTTPIIFATASDDVTKDHLARIGAQGIVKKGTDFSLNLIELTGRLLGA
jgi:CheY-like chemotaxis protein